MINPSELLPLGSVIRMHGAAEDGKLMIINRCVVATWNGEQGYFEYSACPYIFGFEGGKSIYFNHEDIEEICFKGYVDEDEIDVRLRYQGFIESKVLKKLKLRD